jgi:DNA topoisomerase-1
MSKLLIVESPGKIKKISEYLGDDYIVSASVGHIIDLDESSMSINLETFEPEYKIYDNKKDVVSKLIKLTSKVGKDNVFLAADEDREGEMIAWSLARELKLTKPKRIVFNSITAKELKNAIVNTKLIDQHMVSAQQARRILDRFAGYLISPILKKNGFYAAKSAGRVQSVVVKIIVDKEREIESFYKQKKSTYFYICADTKVGEYELVTKLSNKNTKIETIDSDELAEENDNKDEDEVDTKNKKKNKTSNTNTSNTVSTKSYLTFDKSEEDSVVKIIKSMIKAEYSLLKKTERVRKANAPPPFTTSTLQQTASQRMGMDAKRTMSVAQKLYEAGHITYMRTDSTSISEEALKSIKDVIEAEYGLEHYESHKFVNKKANTQEAHECVRPTKPQYDKIDGSSDEMRLYSMIWKRTIQSQMKAAEYQSILIEIALEDKKKILENYKLVGTLENLIYSGYLLVDGKKHSAPLNTKTLSPIDWVEINGIEDTQKPPIRYNDASLINKMDPKNLNIGRPSTYASFIEKIQQRSYVETKDIEGKKIQVNKYTAKKSDPKNIDMETKDLVLGKEKKKLVPTTLGINVTEFLEKNFKLLMDYQFTAKMETELDDIAEGNLDNIKVMKKFYEYVMKCLSEITPSPNGLVNGLNISNPIILGNFGTEEIKLLSGPYGKYIQCGNIKLNLKQLSIELQVDETKLESNKKLLSDSVIEKLNNKITNPDKTWKIKKFTYTLKSGKYGYYIEESNLTNKKAKNYSLNYLIDKIAKENDLDKDKSIEKIIDLITEQNISDTVEYFTNLKKTNKSTKNITN